MVMSPTARNVVKPIVAQLVQSENWIRENYKLWLSKNKIISTTHIQLFTLLYLATTLCPQINWSLRDQGNS